ncbi:MAG: carbohydrate-binding domain-containing protein [Turicibacter sp.]
MHKKLLGLLAMVTFSLGTTACSQVKEEVSETPSSNAEISENLSTDVPASAVTSTSPVSASIVLGENVTVDGPGAVVDQNKVTITQAGTYEISGTLADGQLIVNAGSEDNVELILNGVNMTSLDSAPIYVMSAKNTYLILADGSKNIVSDATTYVYEFETMDEPNAAIFSKDDLIIEGNGELTVFANYNNGIQSKDDLKIKSGTINVQSVGDGLKGKDSITIQGGAITINSGSDGMQTTNDVVAEKGNILIEGGTLDISSNGDGIVAQTGALITDGTISIKTTSLDSLTSTKGIKAVDSLIIDGGNIVIDSVDDSLHSNNHLAVNGGSIKLTSGDDGVHSDATLEINGGDLNILNSYEGIESVAITINDGTIHLVASDDGLNAGGGNDGSAMGRPGQNTFASTSNSSITINGGYVYIDAAGDGIDSNGTIYMTDGTVLVNGPTNGGNGALDYDVTFEQSGGLLVAVGSAGMVQTPSTSSTQNILNLSLTSQEANTLLHIVSENGEEVLTYAPTKSFQSVVISSPTIKTQTNYSVFTGGATTGEGTDGLFTGGTYSNGTEVISLTTSSIITSASQEGAAAAGQMGGRPGGQMGERPEGTIKGQRP